MNENYTRKIKGFEIHKRFVKGSKITDGLSFFKKTNVKYSYVLVSRHWPHLLCWSWSLWITFYKPNASRYCWKPIIRMRQGGTKHLIFRFGLGEFRLVRQPYDWMIRDGFLTKTTEH